MFGQRSTLISTKRRRSESSSVQDMASKLSKLDLSVDTNGHNSERCGQSSIGSLTDDDSIAQSTRKDTELGPASTEDQRQSIRCNSHNQVLDAQEVAVLCRRLYTAAATHLELTVSEKGASGFTFS